MVSLQGSVQPEVRFYGYSIPASTPEGMYRPIRGIDVATICAEIAPAFGFIMKSAKPITQTVDADDRVHATIESVRYPFRLFVLEKFVTSDVEATDDWKLDHSCGSPLMP